jgi:hypothetical protein
MAAPERFAERQILLLHRGRRSYRGGRLGQSCARLGEANRRGGRGALPAKERNQSGKPRKSRERKRRKPLERQQPERKKKYRERQCRADRKQHHKLSNLSARHDTQR